MNCGEARTALPIRRQISLPGGWKPELEKVLLSIEEVELRAGINSCKRAAALYGTTGQAGRAACPERRSRLEDFAACFTLCRPAGTCGTFLLGNSPFGFAAALLAVLGLGLAAYWFINRGKGLTGVELKEAEKALSGLKNELQERRKQ